MKDIAKFDAEYDSSHEATALRTRGLFINRFPTHSLPSMTLDEYVVGRSHFSFCNLVESGTKAWANIQGANSFKFGVYYGRTKTDPTRKYRFKRRFANEQEAFAAMKAALLDLVVLGAAQPLDFAAIDRNPLSQMFKAKILSLYYPERFLAVCSSEHLEMLADIVGFPDDLPYSRYQHMLLDAKRGDPTARKWTAPKFMAYLYKVYVRGERAIESPIEKPRKKKHRRVDFEEMQKQRAEIGRIAEDYALAWEKERLSGANLSHLIERIEDRRDRPLDRYSGAQARSRARCAPQGLAGGAGCAVIARAAPAWWWIRENFRLPALLTIAGCVLSSGAWLLSQHADLVDLQRHDPGPKLEAIDGKLSEVLQQQSAMQQRLDDFAQRIDAQERRWEHVEEIAAAPAPRSRVKQ